MTTLYMVPCQKCGVEVGPMAEPKMKGLTPFTCVRCEALILPTVSSTIVTPTLTIDWTPTP